MRGTVPGLLSAFPIGATLPALYQEDDLARRLTAAFDEVLAPAISTIDNLGAYLDPALTPDDFLEWLGGWVAALLDETWPMARRRAFVAQAADLHRRRGTVGGLADHIRVFTDGEVDIREGGGVAWSATSGGALPGGPTRSLHVRVTVPRAADVDPARLEALVAAAKPAHLGHTVEVVTAGRPTPAA
ncbi:MAG: phage tail protein [Thermoleophilia bacterium]|nr:phage tail protein [Thermoleophilia bacterium]